jgi:hypothetical protein
MKRKAVKICISIAILALVSMVGGYTAWNSMSPDRTCASCHEISGRVDSFHASAHRELKCTDCHGTALSYGVHSLVEKANMVFTHVSEEVAPQDVRMNEAQVLQVHATCMNCHQSEAAKWRVGGHATTYEVIFLDPVHNAMEAPYADCFRCHGMYYDGAIEDLMSPLDQTGPWTLKDPEKADNFTIPCLACHRMHAPNSTVAQYAQEDQSTQSRNPSTSFYSRPDKMHLRVDRMAPTKMFHQGKEMMVSHDPVQALCVRCHSPNHAHEAGTEDDHTPVGVHEGLSCRACHEAHSNNPRHSCTQCHPAISNCNLDVQTMDTTFADPNSLNNIHSVSCGDCHEDERS